MPISPLPLKALALRTVVTEGLYDPELPHCLQVELEKIWLLPGRYRIYHIQRTVERMDKEAMTDAQWNDAMDSFPGDADHGWFGEYITIEEQPDACKWSCGGEQSVEVGYKSVDRGVLDTFFENGGIKWDEFGRDGNGGIDWVESNEWRLTDEGDLVFMWKDIGKDNMGSEVLFIRIFLAKRVNF
jgi:hypothetical protein